MKSIFNFNKIYLVKIVVLTIFLSQVVLIGEPISKDPTPTVKKMIG